MRGEGGRGARGPPLINFNASVIRKHMKMFRFTFQPNRTMNEEFYFFEEGRGGTPIYKILMSIIIGEHMRMFHFKS